MAKTSALQYFLPEMAADPARQDQLQQVYRTTTIDSVRLVWRVSRVGQIPGRPVRDPKGGFSNG